MTAWMIVFGSIALLWIGGYVRWARQMDAAERWQQQQDALRRIGGTRDE